MRSSQVLMVVVAIVTTLCATLTWARFTAVNVGDVRLQRQWQPRCSASNKPCRTRAIMRADFLPGSREIQSPPGCACSPSSSCSDDWEAHSDRVITRELVTNGLISMTFSMMYCGVIQPRQRCTVGQVALQLSGWSSMPMDIDFIHCSCPEHRPMVLHTISTGPDHRQYHAYMCAHSKKKCKRRRSNPDTCMVMDPNNQTITYPCRCTSNTYCQEDANLSRYICKRHQSD